MPSPEVLRDWANHAEDFAGLWAWHRWVLAVVIIVGVWLFDGWLAWWRSKHE